MNWKFIELKKFLNLRVDQEIYNIFLDNLLLRKQLVAL